MFWGWNIGSAFKGASEADGVTYHREWVVSHTLTRPTLWDGRLIFTELNLEKQRVLSVSDSSESDQVCLRLCALKCCHWFTDATLGRGADAAGITHMHLCFWLSLTVLREHHLQCLLLSLLTTHLTYHALVRPVEDGTHFWLVKPSQTNA